MKDQPRHVDISWKLKDLFYPPKIFFIPRIFNKVISVKILVRVTTCSYIMLLNSTMHNKHYLGMNEGMNESSLRCFDDNLVKKQGRTYSTDRSSLARYCDISFFKVQPRYVDISWKLKDLFYPPQIFLLLSYHGSGANWDFNSAKPSYVRSACSNDESNAHNFIKQHIALHYFKVFP